MSTLVETQIRDGVATVALNRPDARNALSRELIDELGEAVDEVDDEQSVRVVILAGRGKAFCAGMDLKAVRDDPAAMGEMLRRLSEVARQIRRLSVPTIAAVQGAAIGGGCGLMVVCDFALTHSDAKLGYPEVDLGICPAVVAPWLVKKIGAGPARAMLLAGGTITGDQGYQRGLATHLVQREAIEQTSLDLATKLAKGGPEAMATTKRWLNELDGSLDDKIFEKAAKLSAEIIAGEEAKGRLRKMFEK